MLNPAYLTKMANDISAFFEAMPSRSDAIVGIAQHIRNTWEPRMIESLKNHATTADGKSSLSALVQAALQQNLIK